MSEEGDKPFGKRAVFDCSEHLPPEPSSPEDREFQRILLAIFNNFNISIQISLLLSNSQGIIYRSVTKKDLATGRDFLRV